VMQTVESIEQFISEAVATTRRLGYHLWWRGQADAEWQLLPSVYRRSRGHRYEKNSTNKFVERAPAFYQHCPPRGDHPAWLGLMQHFRLATRLLDWTESPLVAAFFAVGELDDKDSLIYALDPQLLNKKYWDAEVILNPYGKPKSLFAPPFSDDAPEDNRIAAVPAYYVDARMRSQLAAFTVHGTTTPLNAAEGADSFLSTITIPAAAIHRIQADLFIMGVRRSSIFPELESLAKEINSMNFVE
jgi:hypothetical protein